MTKRSEDALFGIEIQNEETDRFSNRSVRNLVVIHHVDESNIMNELHEANQYVERLGGECRNSILVYFIRECSPPSCSLSINNYKAIIIYIP